MLRAGSHVRPPSAVRANHAGAPPACARRSQTAYTKRESVGSAVMLSLSSNDVRASRINVTGRPHVRPPSLDRLTSTASTALAPNVGPVSPIAAWYAVPSGEIVIHGSEARA